LHAAKEISAKQAKKVLYLFMFSPYKLN
jgi:hypothetical protein